MAGSRSLPIPSRLSLCEAAALLEETFGCSKEEAQGRVLRAIHDQSISVVAVIYGDGSELPVDVTSWHDVDWANDLVIVEGSWSGSPAEFLPVTAYVDRDAFVKAVGIDTLHQSPTTKRPGGRPTQYDWDAFWIETCRFLHDEDVPQTQSKLVNWLLDWFAERGHEDIDRRTVEKKVAALFHALKTERN